MTIVSPENTRFITMERVAELSMQGYTATEIAKELNIKRKDVMTLQEDYRIALSQDMEARDIARDYLNQMTKHFDGLIKKLYETVEEIDGLHMSAATAAQKISAIKTIADLDSKRVDALQKAGLLDTADMDAALEEMEEKKNILVDILRNKLCPTCKANVAYDLSRVSGQAEVIEEATVVG